MYTRTCRICGTPVNDTTNRCADHANEPHAHVDHDGTWRVIDPAGGVWWASEEAGGEITAAENPTATAMRICREQPMRGHWAN